MATKNSSNQSGVVKGILLGLRIGCAVLAILIIVVLSFIFYINFREYNYKLEENAPRAGDAKIIGDDIIYSENGSIRLRRNLRSYYTDPLLLPFGVEFNDIKLDKEIKGDWLGAESPIVYQGNFSLAVSGFSDKNLRIYSVETPWGTLDFNQSAKVEQRSVIAKDDDIDLQIDPAIVYVDSPNPHFIRGPNCNDPIQTEKKLIMKASECVDKEWEPYLLSVTKIKGAINSGDPNNIGHYKIVFYKSRDLKDWREVSSIEIKNRNLEDTKLYYDNHLKKVYALFEVEEYDKGPSEIHIAESSDYGLTWTDKTLVSDGHDNEPAALVDFIHPTLYFSSDKENPGKSYAGANGYVLRLDKNYNPVGKPKKLPIGGHVLLLDAEKCGALIGIRDYLNKDKKNLFYYSLKCDKLIKTIKE